MGGISTPILHSNEISVLRTLISKHKNATSPEQCLIRMHYAIYKSKEQNKLL